jgi:hypothetical protein
MIVRHGGSRDQHHQVIASEAGKSLAAGTCTDGAWHLCEYCASCDVTQSDARGACRWEDGQRVKKRLKQINRWEVHAADEIQIIVDDISVLLRPQPHLLSAAKVGVGACLWDSSIVLTACLGT